MKQLLDHRRGVQQRRPHARRFRLSQLGDANDMPSRLDHESTYPQGTDTVFHPQVHILENAPSRRFLPTLS
jgi:hypothetical protein